MGRITLRQQIENFNKGLYESKDVDTQCGGGWFDWFCEDFLLSAKTEKLYEKLILISSSPKINQDTMYVFFKNNCPMNAGLYDDFRICDIKTGDVLFTVTPSRMLEGHKDWAEAFGKENGFKTPLVRGKWSDVRKWFYNN